MRSVLGDFRPETDSNRVTPRGHQPGGVTVADLLDRSLPLEWFEAVAIARGLCEALFKSGDQIGPASIEPRDVAINALGEVKVSADGPEDGAAASRSAADILRQLLPARDVPMPLRLIASQASLIESIAHFYESLTPFARPNQAAIIRGVYQRAVATPADAVTGSPAPPVEDVTAPMRPAVRRQRGRVLPLAITVIICAAAVAAVIGLINRTTTLPASASQPIVESGRPVVSAAASTVERLVSLVPVLARLADVEGATPPEPRGEWIRLHPTSVQRSSPLSPQSLQLSTPVFVAPGTASSSTTQEVGNAAVYVGSSTSAASRLTYSAGDVDVVPPVAVYPRFPSQLPPGVGRDDIAEFEVLVTETGNVESVRARERPETISEALRVTMGLSAAKSWRFRPGLKDGEPVRYRKVVWVLKN